MFSGIVEEIGAVKAIQRRNGSALLEVNAQEVVKETKVGDSISLNGVCLTVTAVNAGTLLFEAVPATLEGTSLRFLRVSDKVNLERSLKVGDRISGHFVSGHIDCVGIIRKRRMHRGALSLEVSAPAEFYKYIVPKGSVALDGVSLTIAERRSGSFSVNIISHTAANTTLGSKSVSDRLNIEFDILAKKSAN